MERSKKIILVTGASGKQGGAVARHLLSDGWQVRALTRSPDKPEIRALEHRGAEIAIGDLNDKASIAPAFEGVYGVYSVQNTWEHGAAKEIEQGKRVVDLAKENCAQHLVYSSVGSAHRKTGISHFESKWEVEEYIRSRGLVYTILRPVFFMENLFMPDTKEGILSGTLALGLNPETHLQVIAVDDIGVFAAKAFNDPVFYLGREFDIAGDELTGPEMAQKLGAELDRPVQYAQIPIEQIRTFSEEYAVMLEWFNTHGYESGINYLRTLHPGLENFGTWLIRVGWKSFKPATQEAKEG